MTTTNTPFAIAKTLLAIAGTPAATAKTLFAIRKTQKVVLITQLVVAGIRMAR